METETQNSLLELGTYEHFKNLMLVKVAGQSMVKEVEKYDLGVVVLQEIRWKEAGNMDMGKMTILFGGCDERGQFGVGFAVRKNIVPTIEVFRVINPRLALLKIESKWFDIVFINVHTPTEDKSQQEKEDFYTEIELLLEGISNSKIKIVLGDMNAKMGKRNHLDQLLVSTVYMT
ncbi:PREDICTED: uncharacterized protein LOC107165236 [Diuraphis noxia]|uniref:uncharacterized protein LOC107165236 n=1 Tax=Diuraphis noxia TaxID=143948 RepID=UPI0007638AF3|nr:PREDICTED: uncharacterized protein LOC107165236 [Diuraphis noxia]